MSNVSGAAANLLQLVNQGAAANRLNTIEQSLAGSGIGQKNFKGRWLGYSRNNQPTVSVNGRTYNVNAVGFSGKRYGDTVSVRAGKDILSANWR